MIDIRGEAPLRNGYLLFSRGKEKMDIINPSGKKTFKVETDFCGRKLGLEVNRVGFRTTSSVLVTYGDTVVLGSVVVGSKPVMQDFFPLSIDYEEKYYASGKISSSKFIKREGKPSDNAVLIGRLIDRPIRPLFPKGYRQEIQVVATVLSMDSEGISPRDPGGCHGPFDGPELPPRRYRHDCRFQRFDARGRAI